MLTESSSSHSAGLDQPQASDRSTAAPRSPIDEWTILTRRTLARKKRLAVPRSCAISETDLVSGYAGEVSRG